MPRSFTAAVVIVVLGAMYLVLQVRYVRPHLWPAGHGARAEGDTRLLGGVALHPLLLGRPPAVDNAAAATRVSEVRAGSPAADAGVQRGDIVLEQLDLRTRQRVNLRGFAGADAERALRAWRNVYRMGVRDPLRLTIDRDGREMAVSVLRPAAWALGEETWWSWTKTHVAGLLQMVVFITISAVLLAMRASDPTAVLAVLALTTCAMAAGGPPLGGEYLLPPFLQELVLLIAWLATPLGFITTAFAIGYFPRKAKLLVQTPALIAVPFVIAGPMLVLTAAAALFLLGIDATLPIVAWDAAHPWLYFSSFGASVAMNVGIVAEAVLRFKTNPDLTERRRIQIAMITIVPGVLAFAVKDGLPAIALLFGADWTLPWWLTLAFQLIVLLPAFGITYVVAVHRVFAPATVLRQSVKYALARKTLAIVAMLPAIALVSSLVRNRDMSIGALVSGRPLFYLLTTAAVVLTLKYRDRTRVWLDRYFFREAYDAREILLSLASRITYETDPHDLTAMVVERIDTALHPKLAAVLVGGLDEGRLRPISVWHGTAAPLAVDGGLVTMLRWSAEPLELYVEDDRSPARRLPPADQQWLRDSGAVLLVPVFAGGSDVSPQDREMVALIALGERRSEEPYTADDRQLLASIASQIARALDLARLRARADLKVGPYDFSNAPNGASNGGAALQTGTAAGHGECPQCGLCAAVDVTVCPSDGTTLERVSVPHIVDHKYRLDHVIGRGGMGAVYRARDVRLDRDVAIKVVRADLLNDPEARTRFRREAQIVARLQHPAIVSVFDYGTFADGSAFLVMELVRGEDLRRVLRREGSLPASRAVPLLTAICSAVHAAHREGVLHRDLKPENILLVEQDVTIKVLDFGVAKLVSDRAADETGLATVTSAGVVVGTPAYMAPEQLRSEPVDARTDVFSLGVIAYEMLTGELPFGRASVWDIGLQQTQEIKPLQGVPGTLEAVIRRALSVNPAQRPASAADLAAALNS